MTANLYHLSSSEQLEKQPTGKIIVAPAAYVFHHWQPQQCFIHLVDVSDASKNERKDEGHHDGVSSFTTNEYWLCTHVKSIRVWRLDDLGSVMSLVHSGFINELESELFAKVESFYLALILSCPTEQLSQLDSELTLFEKLFRLRGLNSSYERALGRYLRAVPMEEAKLVGLLSRELGWRSGLKNKCSIPMQNRGLTQYIAEYTCCERSIETVELQQALFEFVLVNDICADWLGIYYVRLDAELLTLLIEHRQTERVIIMLQQHNNITIEGDTTHTVDRAVIYGENVLIKLLLDRAKLSGTSEMLELRLLSTLQAANISIDIPTESTVEYLSSWQLEKRTSDLRYSAQNGYLHLCIQQLQQHPYNQADLDAALVLAAEKGYLAILMLLHGNGASLSAGGYWPIKYANRFGYKALKKYLMEQGQPDKSFS